MDDPNDEKLKAVGGCLVALFMAVVIDGLITSVIKNGVSTTFSSLITDAWEHPGAVVIVGLVVVCLAKLYPAVWWGIVKISLVVLVIINLLKWFI